MTLHNDTADIQAFEGLARMNAADTSFHGRAELYIWMTVMYLFFDDEWMKWDIEKDSYAASTSQCYTGQGSQGTVRILLNPIDDSSSEIEVIGNCVHFRGRRCEYEVSN